MTCQRARVRVTDTGSVSAEMALVMPVLMLTVMLVVQTGLWWHATHVAQAAATRAVTTAAASGSSATAGQQAGQDTLAALGSRALLAPRVSVTRTATEARVEVTGRAAAVVPGMSWPVHVVRVRAVEQFVPDPAAGR